MTCLYKREGNLHTETHRCMQSEAVLGLIQLQTEESQGLMARREACNGFFLPELQKEPILPIA